MNRVTLVGKVRGPAKTTTASNGTPITFLEVETHRRWRNNDGTVGKGSEVHTCRAFGGAARLLEKARDRSSIVVRGRLEYTNDDEAMVQVVKIEYV